MMRAGGWPGRVCGHMNCSTIPDRITVLPLPLPPSTRPLISTCPTSLPYLAAISATSGSSSSAGVWRRCMMDALSGEPSGLYAVTCTPCWRQ
jgi:hypothetical protein